MDKYKGELILTHYFFIFILTEIHTKSLPPTLFKA
jgi:hypothetical protein